MTKFRIVLVNLIIWLKCLFLSVFIFSNLSNAHGYSKSDDIYPILIGGGVYLIISMLIGIGEKNYKLFRIVVMSMFLFLNMIMIALTYYW